MSQTWQEELGLRLDAANKVAILGIGSQLRSDDAAGMLVVEALQQRGVASGQVLLMEGSTAPENLTGVIRNFAPELLLAVDAAHLGLEPGDMALLPPESLDGLGFSTHMLPFSLVLRYLEGEGAPEVLLLGIEPLSTDFGFMVSKPVEAAIEELVEFLVNQLLQKR